MWNLGRYEVYEQLGSGSMGVVHRAKDTSLEREVALKTIRTGSDVEPEVRERFYREARACARLDHPNIVTVYDLGEVDLTAFFAMELLRGLDFRQVIQQRPLLPLTTKIDLMVQISEAVHHAHQNGIVHRDIKPSNLFALP
ncbi:MAG TPA: serine/threonine-protein kinase, partial [Bryobacteraceae bacterium]|nr:serine/threonine-protein kinase [Bryobacteraceae bacterium]